MRRRREAPSEAYFGRSFALADADAAKFLVAVSMAVKRAPGEGRTTPAMHMVTPQPQPPYEKREQIVVRLGLARAVLSVLGCSTTAHHDCLVHVEVLNHDELEKVATPDEEKVPSRFIGLHPAPDPSQADSEDPLPAWLGHDDGDDSHQGDETSGDSPAPRSGRPGRRPRHR